MEIDDAVQLIKMEYGEMPDLKLTFDQVQRLWCLSRELCEHVLAILTESRFLFRTDEGFYIRDRDSAPSVQALAAIIRATHIG